MTIAKSARQTDLPTKKRVTQIMTLLGTNNPFLSLAQASRKAKIPLSSLSEAVTAGHVQALVMPDRRRYVAWSEVVQFAHTTRVKREPSAHVLLRLVALSKRFDAQDLPSDFALNHDKYIRNVPE